MIGRGLIANPQLAEMFTEDGRPDKVRWKAFHDEICAGYEDIMSGERNVLFKMKELWNYMLPMFEDGEKIGKKIKKSVKKTYRRVNYDIYRSQRRLARAEGGILTEYS